MPLENNENYFWKDESATILMDEYTSPGSFPAKMDGLISAIGWSEQGVRVEHSSNSARTIIWLGLDYGYSQKNYSVNILRLNPYSMQSSKASCLSAIYVTKDEEGNVVDLSLSKHPRVSGSYFTPFDIGNIRSSITTLRGDELQVESLHLKDFRGRPACPEDIEFLAQICQGVNIFLSRFIQKNMKRGWDQLPSVGNY